MVRAGGWGEGVEGGWEIVSGLGGEKVLDFVCGCGGIVRVLKDDSNREISRMLDC
jgi:hypothetical protein